ncbi:hypothetical protein E2C01_023993 [Portunus trituberculatus]|uniref:Uncharacterized protein n=1 Tax=Portunus trituberculatus TaxID=210409 RepID=A0A5B7ECN3_PORTR|nr:hypothetical protein [Portunus trituberculatus]
MGKQGKLQEAIRTLTDHVTRHEVIETNTPSSPSSHVTLTPTLLQLMPLLQRLTTPPHRHTTTPPQHHHTRRKEDY